MRKFFLALVILTVASASAQVGVSLPADLITPIKGGQCGFINGAWLPGNVNRVTGLFYSLPQQIIDTNKRLKNKKLTSTARLKLKLKIANLKSKLRQQRKSCEALVGPGATPTATPIATVLPTSSATPTPAPGSTIATWDVTANELKDNLGAEYLFFCPASSTGTLGGIYGDYTYTTDSKICVAAVHAGRFLRGLGGNVRFKIKGAQTLYIGALRNSVQSSFFGTYATSYSFLDLNTGAELTPPTAPPISATQNASGIYQLLGQQFTFICPAASGTSGGSVWGTDVYTYDSSICRAAVHAGRISNANGGQVTIAPLAGQAAYTGSTRNGITSTSYGSWGGSFSFVP